MTAHSGFAQTVALTEESVILPAAHANAMLAGLGRPVQFQSRTSARMIVLAVQVALASLLLDTVIAP
eukprot:COSAG02_NODE_48352_length_334_cov_0.872340_1_plen_66_part_01